MSAVVEEVGIGDLVAVERIGLTQSAAASAQPAGVCESESPCHSHMRRTMKKTAKLGVLFATVAMAVASGTAIAQSKDIPGAKNAPAYVLDPRGNVVVVTVLVALAAHRIQHPATLGVRHSEG